MDKWTKIKDDDDLRIVLRYLFTNYNVLNYEYDDVEEVIERSFIFYKGHNVDSLNIDSREDGIKIEFMNEGEYGWKWYDENYERRDDEFFRPKKILNKDNLKKAGIVAGAILMPGGFVIAGCLYLYKKFKGDR